MPRTGRQCGPEELEGVPNASVAGSASLTAACDIITSILFLAVVIISTVSMRYILNMSYITESFQPTRLMLILLLFYK